MIGAVPFKNSSWLTQALVLLHIVLVPVATVAAQDWSAYPVPANAGPARAWAIDTSLSDQFNYTYTSSNTSGQSEFFSKWIDFNLDGWQGPGATQFTSSNYYVDGGKLTIFASKIPLAFQTWNYHDFFYRTMYSSYITSISELGPGTYTEVMMKGSSTPLSSNFWMLGVGNQTEIDAMEIYGDSKYPGYDRFNPASAVHFFRNGHSANQLHHPRDGIDFAATWHRYGVYWVNETKLEFYYDGILVRTMDLAQNPIDPTGQNLNEPVRIILDLEAHAWRGVQDVPTDAQLANSSINNMQVDWIRTYRTVPASTNDWESIAVPASPGANKTWVLDSSLSDSFNYSLTPANLSGQAEFSSKWIDFNPDGWTGPAATVFNPNNYFVDGGALTIFASRIPLANQTFNHWENLYRTVYSGYITSINELGPESYTELMMKGSPTAMSSNFWMLGRGQTEIDVMQIYGDEKYVGLDRYSPASCVHFYRGFPYTNNQRHHRNSGIDYAGTWHRYGLHWVSANKLEFYYDGQLVRTLDFTQTPIDPSGLNMNEQMRLIMNLDTHGWRGPEDVPTDAQLSNFNINNMQVDWIRTYRAAP